MRYAGILIAVTGAILLAGGCDDQARRDEIALFGGKPPVRGPAGPDAAAPSGGAAAAPNAKVAAFLEEMREMTGEMSQTLRLSAAQRQQVTALHEQVAQRLSADPGEIERKGPALVGEIMESFNQLLTPSQREQFHQKMRAAQDTSVLIHSMSRLRMIGIATHRYTMRHGGAMPPDLAAVVEEGLIEPADLLHPSSERQVPAGLPDSGPQAAQWARQNADYVYLAGGKTRDRTSGGFVVAHDPVRQGATKMAFVLGDGSAHGLEIAKAQQVLSEIASGQNPPQTPVR